MRKTPRNASAAAGLLLAVLAGAPGLAAPNPPKPPPAVLGQELFRFGTKGIGPSQMTDLDFIAVDPQGFLYVSDYALGRVQRFSRDGKLDSLFYLEPGAHPRSLAFDRGGILYIVLDGRLRRYDPTSWTLVGEVEPPPRCAFFRVAARPGGGVMALSAGETEDVVFLRGDGTIERTLRDPLKGRSDFSTATPLLAVDSQDHLYVADNHVTAIFRFDSQGRFMNRFSSKGEGPGQIQTQVDGMAIDSLGQVWVGDWRGTNVFAPDGRFLRRFDDVDGDAYVVSDQDELYAVENTAVIRYAAGDRPLPATGGGEPGEPAAVRRPKEPSGRELKEPAGLVAADPRGFLYMADSKAGRILRFNAQNQLEGPLEIRGPGRPWTGLAIDRGGTLYLAAENRLFRYDPTTGKLLGEVRHPDGEGFFHVAARPDAGVIASWRNAQRDDLVLVGKDGTIEKVQRNAVSAVAGEPAGGVLVAMDGRRNLYAVANRLHAIFLFDLQGSFVNRFGSEGEEPGQLSGTITGLAVNGQGRIFVSDEQRINVFATEDGRFLRRREGGGSGLAIGDDVFAVNGPRIARFPVGQPEKD